MKYWFVFAFALLTVSTTCLVLSTEVLSPPSLAGATFVTVAYPSGPAHIGFDDIELVWYKPGFVGEECKSETFPLVANGTQAIVHMEHVGACWPEQFASIAKQKGFSAIIIPNSFTRVGCSAAGTWGSNSAPIPIFELYQNAPGWKSQVTERLKLIPEAGGCTQAWILNSIPAFLVCGAAALFKIVVCGKALFKYQFKLILAQRSLTAAQAVLLIEFITSFASLLMILDFMGMSHILPMWVWFPNLNFQYMLTFLSTYILSITMLKIESEVKDNQFGRRRMTFLNIAFALFCIISAIGIISVGYMVYQDGFMAMIELLLYFVFQLSFGIFLFRSKKRLISVLVQGARGQKNSEKLEQLEKMSDCLYISSFFMLLYSVMFVPAALGYGFTASFDIVLTSLLVQNICNAATGVTHVLALPTKTTGINFSTRSKMSKTVGRESRESSPADAEKRSKIAITGGIILPPDVHAMETTENPSPVASAI